MKRSIMAACLGMLVLVGVSSSASAWTKFRNRSSFRISTAHAFASTSALGCGWDDGCTSFGNWRVQGWWSLNPGEVQTVHSLGWGNAYHDAYGEDGTGRVWGGGGGNTVGGSYCAPQTGFNHCSGTCTTDMRRLLFFRARGARCCGGTCPGDGYVNFNN